MNDAAKELIYSVTDNLVDIGNREDITKLPADEQIAYWLNLHNMLVISTILKHYPAASPSKLTVGESQLAFHEAPLAVIKGVPLSLRDIRIGIVYKNWKDPRVFYGFFHGDLASPNIRAAAYSASTLWKNLDLNAKEFVNALRGVERSGQTLLVSPLFEEGRGTLFTKWPDDLREHLAGYANTDVTAELANTSRIRHARYEHRTADMIGGQKFTPMSKISAGVIGPPGSWNNSDRMRAYPLASPNFGLSYTEFTQKFVDLKRAGKKRADSEVIITDLPPAQDSNPAEAGSNRPKND